MLIKGRFPKEILLVLYVILFLASTGVQAFEQVSDEEHPFGLQFDDESVLEPQNGVVTTEFRFEIPDQYYLYVDKMAVTLTERVQANMTLPPGVKILDLFSNSEKDVYYNAVVLPVTFTLPKDFDSDRIAGEIEYQGCSDTLCFRAMSQEFSFPINRVPDSQPAQSNNSQSGFFSRLLSHDLDLSGENFLALYAMAFALGVLSSLSVCVLPLVPLTIAFMGARRDLSSRKKTAGLLLLFLAGLVSMNAPLGAAAAWLGLKLGFQYQNPYFLAFVTLLFLFVGVWMLGVFHLQLPNRWQTAASRWQPRGSAKAYVSGLTIGILSFACVGPFLLPLMTFVAGSGNFVLGISVMVAFSAGMSVLFVLAAFFSSAWMRRFGGKSFLLKRLMGVVMIGFAAYFGWIFAKSYILPKPEGGHAFFRSDFTAAQAEAKAENKNLLVDFYADWCLPCQRWEIEVWSKTDVREAVLQNYVPVKIDCTIDTPVCDEMTGKFSIRGMPTLLFLRSDGEELQRWRIEGSVMGSEEFLEYLEQIQTF